MRYCENCGTGHECEVATEGRAIPEVEIARINADRDVAVAKLAARQTRDELATAEDIAETQADAEVEAAVAEAEMVAAAIAAGITPEPEPVIIDAPEAIADEPDDAPPPAEGSEPPAAKHRTVGLGAW
jgi:hypothetical protein